MDRNNWTGGTRSSYSELWITIPIAVLATCLALCLVLPLILYRYCRNCCEQDACCGPYFRVFEGMLDQMSTTRQQRRRSELDKQTKQQVQFHQEMVPIEQKQPFQQYHQQSAPQHITQPPPRNPHNFVAYNQTEYHQQHAAYVPSQHGAPPQPVVMATRKVSQQQLFAGYAAPQANVQQSGSNINNMKAYMSETREDVVGHHYPNAQFAKNNNNNPQQHYQQHPNTEFRHKPQYFQDPFPQQGSNFNYAYTYHNHQP